MRSRIFKLHGLAAGLLLAATFATAQPAGMNGPPPLTISGALAKLFGDNPAFSAKVDISALVNPAEPPMHMEGNVACLDSKSRFEFDMTKITGTAMPPGAAAQMQRMGLSPVVMLSLPEQSAYMIYPSLKAYVTMPTQDPDSTKPANDFKLQTTELGGETVDGHPCLKYKAVVSGSSGQPLEATVWNATDLHKFPLKIERMVSGPDGRTVKTTMTFKDIDFSKPPASTFELPAGYTKYDSMMSMMMQHMGQGHPLPPTPPSQP